MSKFSKKANKSNNPDLSELLQGQPIVINKNSDIVAVVDLDFVKYSCASVGEKRSIKVTHKASGKEKVFNNKTEFWGRGKKIGGWLGEQIEKKGVEWTKDDFEIEDIQEVSEPLENILHSAKVVVDGAVKKVNAGIMIPLIGKGDSFRVELSTLLEYKGNRKNQLKPLLLDDVVEYLIKKYHPEIIKDIEVDDKCVMIASQDPKYVVIGTDKDYYGCPVNVYNPDRPHEGIVDCRGLGSLWRDDKGKVRGKGEMFKVFQIISYDTVDNYKANCFSNIKWGEVSAYEALKDCKDSKELWEAAVKVFKHLYPEEVEIKGWRGDLIKIDWLYVMQEMFNMAHLHTKENDFINCKEVLDKLGVEYE